MRLVLAIEQAPAVGRDKEVRRAEGAEFNDALYAVGVEVLGDGECDCHLDDERLMTLRLVEATARLASPFEKGLTVAAEDDGGTGG